MKLLIDNCDSEIIQEKLIDLLQTIADDTASELGLSENAEVSLLIVGNQEIGRLNELHRGISAPTDVLSFPMLETEDDITTADMLGDIVISLPAAKEQAVDYNHSLEREVAFLFSHGLLHLVGYDHNSPEEEEEMRTIQEKILIRIGLKRG